MSIAYMTELYQAWQEEVQIQDHMDLAACLREIVRLTEKNKELERQLAASAETIIDLTEQNIALSQ